MNTPNAGDLLMWCAVSVAFFRAMDSGYRLQADGQTTFEYSSWLSALIKSAIVVCPLLMIMISKEARTAPWWDLICLIVIACFSAPIAFPQLTVELRKRSLSEKITNWLFSRFDIIVKKGLLVLLLTWIASYAPTAWLAGNIPLPAYFATRGQGLIGTFTGAMLFIAFLSVALRSTLVIQKSKILAVALLPLGVMLVGYVINLGSSMNHSNTPYSLSLCFIVVVDLAMYLLSASSGTDA
ncbi:MAG: hypothetical protein QM740_11820 [Acidovorax sp.]